MSAVPAASADYSQLSTFGTLGSAPARVRFGDSVRVRASCPFVDCRLSIVLKAQLPAAARVAVLAQSTRKLTFAHTVTVTLRLTASTKRRVARWLRTHRALKVSATLVATGPTGKQGVKHLTTSLRRAS